MPGKPTIQDIARLAGKSKTTISRVLNNKPDVDPDTRERILRIIDEQGFIPSIPAAGLASGRRQLIGMLIPSFTWPLIPELMRGVSEVLEQTSYELVLYSINDTDLRRDRSEVINRVLATQLTAGLLAVFPGPASQDLTRLYHQGFPVVIVDDQLEQTTPWVGVDNTTGAYTVVRHLVLLGHGVSRISRDPMNTWPRMIATMVIARHCWKGVLLLIPNWYWRVTSCHQLVVPAQAHSFNSRWRSAPPLFSPPLTKWPMACWRRLKSMG